jgi:hypothetical protein
MRCTPKSVMFLAFAAGMLMAVPQLSYAETIVSADFSTYDNGDLVGQNGWIQFGTVSSSPIQVNEGVVSWPGGRTVSNQDAMLPFASQITQPDSGSIILNYDILMSVATAGGNPSYFAALTTRTDSETNQNFANARLVARSQDDGFVFGTRVNGQGGYPFAYGSTMLEFDEIYALRAEINMVAGNANDFINLYVGPNFDELSLYATAEYGSGTVSDPSFGGMLLSQFGSGSVNEAGVSIYSMGVSVVPEPSTLILLLLGSIAAAGVGRRFRKR